MLRFRRATVALVVLMTLSPTLVFGQASMKAGIVTTLEGRATATRVVLPQPVALTFKDDVFLNDEITTAEKSLARILLGGKAVVTVRERSSLTITEVPGLSTIDIASGKIAVSVARERMRPGERIQIRTPNAITGIRGTSLIVDVIRSIADIRQPDPNVLTRLGVFEGDVDVQHIHPVTKAPLAPPVNVTVNTKFTATGAQPAAVGPFQPGDAQSFQAGLTPSAPQHVQAANEPQLAFQALETADTLIRTLLGGTSALVTPPVNISPPTTTTVDPELNNQRVIATPTTTRPTVPPPPPPPPGRPPLPSGVPSNIVVDPALDPFVGATTAATAVQIPDGSGLISTAGSAFEVQTSIDVPPPLTIPLLTVTNGNLVVSDNLLNVIGSLSSTTTLPILSLDPTTLTTGGDVVRVSSGGSLAVASTLLSDSGGTLNAGGSVIAVEGDARLTSTATTPLLRFTGTAAGASRVTADGNFVFLSANTPPAPAMSLSAPLVVATLSDLRNGDAATSARSFLAVLDGASLASSSADALVSLLDGSSLTTSGSVFSIRRSGASPSTMQLAGPLLIAQDSAITPFATALRDAAGAQRLCCNVLGVGQGAEFTSSSTSPLIDLARTTVSLGHRFVVVFDTTSIFGEPTITAPASVQLAGPLARITGGRITGLQDFLGIFRSSLDSSTAEPLIQLDSTPVTMGGTSPINGATVSGRLLSISGSATTPATLTLAGPLFSANNSVITTTDDLFGVFGGALVTSTTREPFLSITGGSATAAAIGSFFVMAAAAGVPPPVVSLEGGLLRARGTTLVNGDPGANTQAFMFVGDGASLSSTSPDALFDFGRTTVRTGTLLTVRRPGATPSMIDLDGPFLIATDSSINTTTSSLRNNANQLILCCNVLSVGQGARFNSDSIDPFIDLARTGVITGDRLVSVFDVTSLAGETPLPPTRSFLTLDGPLVRSVGGGISTVKDLVGIFRSSVTSTTLDPLIAVNGTPLSLGGISQLDGSATAGRVLLMQGSPTLPAMLDLRGPLFNANNAVVTTTADGFSFFNGSHGISTTPNPFIAITGGSFTAGPNGTFLGLASNAGQASSSLSLEGPLLSATGTTLRNGNPGTNDVTFFFVGDSATLTSTTPQSLLAFDTTTVDSAANMLTLRRSTSAAAPSLVSLRGPLLTGTNSRFNTSGFSGFFVAEGARLSSTTLLPLINLAGSTFNAAPGEQGGFDFFSLTDSFGGPALPASVALAGPFLRATDSQINARSHLLGVTRSSFTSTSTEPLVQLDNATVNATSSVTRVVDGQLLASTVSALASLVNNSTVTSGSHAVDVTGPNGNVELRDLVRLTNSIMTVNNGHLVNLNAGRLNVTGDLVALAGNSTLNILNGLLLNMTGGTATIGDALVRFTGANNTINVTNTIRPNFFASGIPIFVGAGTPNPQIFGQPVAGTGAININGARLALPENATGSLIAVQGGARLRIGNP